MIIYSKVPLDQRKKELIIDFIKLSKERLGIQVLPGEVHLLKHRSEPGMTTGEYNPHKKTVKTIVGRRLLLDVLRSICHELTHHKQNEKNELYGMSQEYNGDLYDPRENEAYLMAGNIVKEWARATVQKHPDLYEIYF